MKNIFVIISIFLFAGCATQYKADGLTGGYSQIQINEKTWQVSFRGNGYTSKNRAQKFAMRRAAEITIEQGYTHFIITQSSSQISTMETAGSSMTTGNIDPNSGYFSSNTTNYGGMTFSFPTENSYFVLLTKEEADQIGSLNGLVYNAELYISQFAD